MGCTLKGIKRRVGRRNMAQEWNTLTVDMRKFASCELFKIVECPGSDAPDRSVGLVKAVLGTMLQSLGPGLKERPCGK